MAQPNIFHTIQSLTFNKDRLILDVDGKVYACHLPSICPQLDAASEEARIHFEISPSGYGIYWPLLDLDLSIDGLIRSSILQEQSA